MIRKMARASALLGWTPASFWAATPVELQMCLVAIGYGQMQAPLTRADLTRLQNRLEA